MKKKVVSLLAAMALTVVALTGCGSAAADTTDTAAEAAEGTEETADAEAADTETADADTEAAEGADMSSVKAGFIFLHDENSTYDLNFLNAAKAA